MTVSIKYSTKCLYFLTWMKNRGQVMCYGKIKKHLTVWKFNHPLILIMFSPGKIRNFQCHFWNIWYYAKFWSNWFTDTSKWWIELQHMQILRNLNIHIQYVYRNDNIQNGKLSLLLLQLTNTHFHQASKILKFLVCSLLLLMVFHFHIWISVILLREI